MEELRKFIDYTKGLYSRVTEEWLKEEAEPFNLSKKLVSDIQCGNPIYEEIFRYSEFIKEKLSEDSIGILFACSHRAVFRYKTQNSIEDKIRKYQTGKEHGKIPIKKCFNDLFGMRIFLEEPKTFEEISAFIGAEYKCIDSSKGDYKATHLYFSKNNYAFPWELQIWNVENEETNLLSHQKYKQGYTVWEQERSERK